MIRRRQRGLALLSVLWVGAVLAVLAAGFASDTRTESRLVRNQLENAQAEALADAGVYDAARRLYRRNQDKPWRERRNRYRFRLGGGVVRVEIEDEEAKVDLNYAPPDLLQGLIAAVGAEPEVAEALAARIQDFRDADQEPAPLGAEDDDYLAAGLVHEAKDAPFAALNELLLVPGMTEELYLRLRPHLTLFSGNEGIDPARAAPTVLRAVPGMTDEVLDAILALGPDEDVYDVIEDDLLYELETYFLFSSESMFMVRSAGRSRGGGTFVREAVVELIGDPDQPLFVHDWRRGRLPPEPAEDEAGAS